MYLILLVQTQNILYTLHTFRNTTGFFFFSSLVHKNGQTKLLWARSFLYGTKNLLIYDVLYPTVVEMFGYL